MIEKQNYRYDGLDKHKDIKKKVEEQLVNTKIFSTRLSVTAEMLNESADKKSESDALLLLSKIVSIQSETLSLQAESNENCIDIVEDSIQDKLKLKEKERDFERRLSFLEKETAPLLKESEMLIAISKDGKAFKGFSRLKKYWLTAAAFGALILYYGEKYLSILPK